MYCVFPGLYEHTCAPLSLLWLPWDDRPEREEDIVSEFSFVYLAVL